MSKVAHYLQEHVVGEVLTSTDVRKYFSCDASVFTVVPSMVLYPRNESDVRKTTRFIWQLAERGRIVPITARGLGANQTGSAVGSGIIMSFPAHMNNIVDYEAKHGTVTVQPGINYGRLLQALETHDRTIPAYPVAADYSTIGGALADNASGEKSFKYGDTRKYVKKLRVVLANGEVIETERLAKRELNKKLGLATFEGEIYRALDKLLEESEEITKKRPLGVVRNAAGYEIWDIVQKDGSLDLTPLFIGSQGTLGIITEATLATTPCSTETTVITATVDDVNTLGPLLEALQAGNERPSSIDLLDESLLAALYESNPNLLRDVVERPFPKALLIIECDDVNIRLQKKIAKKVTKLLSQHKLGYKTEVAEKDRERVAKLRDLAASAGGHTAGNAKAVPVIGDGAVPLAQFGAYLTGFQEILKRNNVQPAIYGHAGDGILYARPSLDLSEVGDRQKAFKLMDEYSKLVISLGGTTTGTQSDGRLRGPYLASLFGAETYEVFKKIKDIFDPYRILNPGVKVEITTEDTKPLLRYDYSVDYLYNFLPRV